MIVKEKIPLKLLRLTPAAQEGMIMIDYPYELAEAELMEEYRGGLNAFVHISLPDDVCASIEDTKIVCQDCGKTYYKEDTISDEHGIRIETHIPEDGHCFDCGSTNLAPGNNPDKFNTDMALYMERKEDLLAFYNDLGLLIDFEPRRGYEDYEKLKRRIQYTIKH